MTRQAIIERTIKAINQLPEDKAAAISTFAEFIIQQHKEQHLTQQHLAAESETFGFLWKEEDLYNESDIKEVYK